MNNDREATPVSLMSRELIPRTTRRHNSMPAMRRHSFTKFSLLGSRLPSTMDLQNSRSLETMNRSRISVNDGKKLSSFNYNVERSPVFGGYFCKEKFLWGWSDTHDTNKSRIVSASHHQDTTSASAAAFAVMREDYHTQREEEKKKNVVIVKSEADIKKLERSSFKSRPQSPRSSLLSQEDDQELDSLVTMMREKVDIAARGYFGN